MECYPSVSQYAIFNREKKKFKSPTHLRVLLDGLKVLFENQKYF